MGEPSATWKPIGRSDLVRLAASGDPNWKHLGIVCGAGLGKTTNLQWLESAVNALDRGFHRQLAWFLELRHLPRDHDQLLESMVQRVREEGRVDDDPRTIRHGLRRLLTAGRVTFLLDSLDQADPSPRGPAVAAWKAWLRASGTDAPSGSPAGRTPFGRWARPWRIVP